MRENDFYVTRGLFEVVNFELKIFIKNRKDDEYFEVLKYLVDYILKNTSDILPGQTISYYSWLLKFVKISDTFLLLWEAHKNGEDYCVGVDYAIRIINEQRIECSKHKVLPVFPSFNQNIVISKGVYEGLDIDAVRYPSPSHMTGWWLTTELYDDNIDSLMNVHYYHVAFKRSDILKYLALPLGYRFYSSTGKIEVWYDEKVLE